MRSANQRQRMRLRPSSAIDHSPSSKPSILTLLFPIPVSPTSAQTPQKRRCSAPPKPSIISSDLKNAAKYLNSFVTIFHTMARLRCSLDVLRVVLWSRSLECTISKSSRQILRSFGRHTWITLLILGRFKYDKLSPRAAVCSSPKL